MSKKRSVTHTCPETAPSASAATLAGGCHRHKAGAADISCTAALEMAALLLDLEPGDEVIMPSFTFVSTANAVRAPRAPCRCSWTSAPTRSTSTRRLDRGCDHAPHPGHRRRPLRGRRLRDGRDHGDRAAARPARRRGRGAGPARGLPGRPLGSIGDLGASASTRRRTSSAARAARCS